MLRNPPIYSFVSFSIVSLILSINRLDSSRDLINFMMSFISLFGIIGDTAALNPNGTKMLLANTVSRFSFNGKPNFINGPIKLSRKSPFLFIIFLVVSFPTFYRRDYYSLLALVLNPTLVKFYQISKRNLSLFHVIL